MIAAIPRMLERFPSLFPRTLLTPQALEWAVATVLTRSLPIEDDDEGLSPSLAPFLDFTNTSHEPTEGNTATLGRAEDGGVVLQGNEWQMNSHSAALASYGEHPNTHLLTRYGFALEHNPHSSAVLRIKTPADALDQDTIKDYHPEGAPPPPEHPTPADDEFAFPHGQSTTDPSMEGVEEFLPECEELANGDLMWSFAFFDHPCILPLPFVRVFRSIFIKKAGMEGVKSSAVRLPVKYELQVFQRAVKSLEAKVSRFPSTIQDDLNLLQNHTLQGLPRSIITLRMQQKKIFMHNLERAEDVVHTLEDEVVRRERILHRTATK